MNPTADASPTTTADLARHRAVQAAQIVRKAQAERRAILASLSQEIAVYEAAKRRRRADLNAWVARWVRQFEISTDDLTALGEPRADRVDPEAAGAWRAHMAHLTLLTDRERAEHDANVSRLMEKLEACRQRIGAGCTLPVDEGCAVSLATRHALTMVVPLAPVYPA